MSIAGPRGQSFGEWLARWADNNGVHAPILQFVMDQPILMSRRRFHALAGSALAMTATSAFAQQPQSPPATASGQRPVMFPTPRTIKCLDCDLNWVRTGDKVRAATAADWVSVDPQEYFDYHREVGNNILFFQAYNQGGLRSIPQNWGRSPRERVHNFCRGSGNCRGRPRCRSWRT